MDCGLLWGTAGAIDGPALGKTASRRARAISLALDIMGKATLRNVGNERADVRRVDHDRVT
jgi:hypothetical protein